MTDIQDFKELRQKREKLVEELKKADEACCLIRQEIKELDQEMLGVTVWR